MSKSSSTDTGDTGIDTHTHNASPNVADATEAADHRVGNMGEPSGTSWPGKLLRAIVALGLLGALLIAVYLIATDPPPVAQWTREDDAPVQRFESVSTVVGEDLYRFSGFGDGLETTRAFYRYDRDKRVWKRLGDAPAPVTHCNAVVDGHVFWIAGGFVGNDPGKATSSVWLYDTRTDQWTAQTPLPELRAGGALVRLGRTLHYFGGFGANRDTVHGDHWALNLDDPRDWEPRAPLPVARGHLAGAVLDGFAYALGGQLRHDTKPFDLALVHAYDPTQDMWTERASLLRPRSHHEQSTFVIEGRILTLGGRDTATERNRFFRRRNGFLPLDSISLYDPAVNRWKDLSRLPVGLLGPSAHKVGDEIILMGGTTSGPYEPQNRVYSIPVSELLYE